MNNINDLIGKNILIFDLETSGLPSKKPYFATGIDEFYEPTNLEKYNSSRIVSLAYTYIKNFNLDSLNKSVIKTYVRKPFDFIISKENSKFHGITHKKAILEGVKLSNIISDGFTHDLADCDYVVGHNILFDIFVLLSELHRMKFKNTYENLKFHLDKNKYLCTGELGRDICKLSTKIKKYNYKMPKLEELYKNFYDDNNIIFHDAENDVRAVVRILAKIIAQK
jgi:DNA polymerase III epsilon subunit-like protein